MAHYDGEKLYITQFVPVQIWNDDNERERWIRLTNSIYDGRKIGVFTMIFSDVMSMEYKHFHRMNGLPENPEEFVYVKMDYKLKILNEF